MDDSQAIITKREENVTNHCMILRIAAEMIIFPFRWFIWAIAVLMDFLCGCACCLVCGSAKNREVIIQLYCAQETDMTDYAVQELVEKLKSYPFHVEIRKEISSIERNMPLIVICLTSARLSEDLQCAMFGVPTGSKTVVLIFHHLKPHALPTESSNTILTKDEVSDLGIIIDAAIFETMGMYECDMNIRAYQTLITFIDDNCKK